MDLPLYETLLIERNDGIATLSLNRPKKKNAMNPQLAREALDALQRLEFDPDTRVLVVTGAGDMFCAGMDLKEYFLDVEGDQSQRDRNRRVATEWTDRLLRLYAKPTIAMVNGDCYGGAFQIVASCDIAVAADEALFGLSEVNFGYQPGGMVAKVIHTMMPYRHAVYYAMTGQRFDGRRAAEINFVTRSVPRARLVNEVTEIAHHLAKLDPDALRASKESVKQVAQMSYEEASWFLTAKGNDLHWRRHQKGLSQEGIEKFLAKEYRPASGSYTEAKKKEG